MWRIASFISFLKVAAQYGHASDRVVRISAGKRRGGGRGGVLYISGRVIRKGCENATEFLPKKLILHIELNDLKFF
jgi:hypothetical protein